MARHVHHMPLQRTDIESLAIFEQLIKLRSIGGEAGFKIEDVFEYLLHRRDVVANRNLAAQMLAQVRRSADVISMRAHLPRVLFRRL